MIWETPNNRPLTVLAALWKEGKHQAGGQTETAAERISEDRNNSILPSFVHLFSLFQEVRRVYIQTVAAENISFAIKLNLHKIINETSDCQGNCDEHPVTRRDVNELQYTMMTVVTSYSN